jgi:pimeloyl-ACP methyl ester carboxylesterase
VPTATLPDGAALAYDDYDFTTPWDPGEPVVLVHGFSKNRRMWYGWLPGLTAHYRVIRVDQRGHGDSSPAPPGFQMGLRPFSQDMADFLDAIGLESAHFVMAEFTSAVAVDFANAFSHRIRSLTLPGFTYNMRGSKIDRTEWVRLAEQEGSLAWARATNQYRLPADAPQAMRDWYISEQARVPGWFLGALFRWSGTLDLTGQLPGIKVPTLIIAGSDARQGTIEQVRDAARVIPDCRLAVLDGMPFNVMSAAPDRCVAETLRFIADVRARQH